MAERSPLLRAISVRLPPSKVKSFCGILPGVQNHEHEGQNVTPVDQEACRACPSTRQQGGRPASVIESTERRKCPNKHHNAALIANPVAYVKRAIYDQISLLNRQTVV